MRTIRGYQIPSNVFLNEGLEHTANVPSSNRPMILPTLSETPSIRPPPEPICVRAVINVVPADEFRRYAESRRTRHALFRNIQVAEEMELTARLRRFARHHGGGTSMMIITLDHHRPLVDHADRDRNEDLQRKSNFDSKWR